MRRFAMVVALVLTACGQAADSEEPIEHSASALTANDKTAFDYFLGKGLAPFQAAGIVGNLDQESNMDPGAVQPGGPGRGIAQWSVGGRWDSDANDNAKAYAAAHGKTVTSLSLQLDFIWYELTTFPNYGLAALKKSTDVTQATIAFENDFEGCGNCLESKRIAYAKAALAAYGADTVDAGSDAAAPKHDAGTSSSSGGSSSGEPVAPPASTGTNGTNGASPPTDHSGADLHPDSGGCSVALTPPTNRSLPIVALAVLIAAGARASRRRRSIQRSPAPPAPR
jgi:hypothetical protein